MFWPQSILDLRRRLNLGGWLLKRTEIPFAKRVPSHTLDVHFVGIAIGELSRGRAVSIWATQTVAVPGLDWVAAGRFTRLMGTRVRDQRFIPFSTVFHCPLLH